MPEQQRVASSTGIERDLATLKNVSASERGSSGRLDGDRPLVWRHSSAAPHFLCRRQRWELDRRPISLGRCGRAASRPDNLHAVWDNCLLEAGLFERVRQRADFKKMLEQEHDHIPGGRHAPGADKPHRGEVVCGIAAVSNGLPSSYKIHARSEGELLRDGGKHVPVFRGAGDVAGQEFKADLSRSIKLIWRRSSGLRRNE